MISCCRALSSVALLHVWCIFRVGHAFAPPLHARRLISNSRIILLRSTGDEGEEEDWRAFRARLVQTGIKTHDEITTTESTDEQQQDSSDRWAFSTDKNVERGTILLSIPTLDLCQGIAQNYFHRCVVLVTDTDVRWEGDDDDGDDAALVAGGVKSELGGIRGILLNRPTNLLVEEEGEDDDDSVDGWNIWYGGDISGLHNLQSGATTEFVCLHTLNSKASQEVSIEVMPGLSYSTLDGARKLVADGDAQIKDFYSFGGYCAWRPSQLQLLEMGDDRDEWYSVSMDKESILDEMKRLKEQGTSESEELITGVEMWDRLISTIGKTEDATQRLSPARLKFYDGMLHAWAEENLVYGSVEDLGGDAIATLLRVTTEEPKDVEPGMIVRASVRNKVADSEKEDTPPFMLADQELHRGTVLILEEGEGSTIGVILNLPMGGEVEVMDGVSLPLRYGGPIGAEDTLDAYDEGKKDVDEGDPFTWLHYRDPSLPQANIGTPLGKSGIYSLTDEEVITALQEGKVKGDEIMVIAGLCVWEKDDELGLQGGGMMEQVRSLGTFEIAFNPGGSSADTKRISKMWSLLQKQKVLTSETMGENIEIAVSTWEAFDEDITTSADDGAKAPEKELLADAALQAWVSVNLLGEPLSTDIETTWPIA